MRCQHAWPDDRSIERRGLLREGRQGIGVEERGATGPQHGEHSGAGLRARSGTGADQQGRESAISEQAVEVFRRRQGVDHDASQRRRIDGQGDLGHRDRRQTHTGAGRRTGRHSRGAGHRVASGDQRVAAGVLVAALLRPWQRRPPESRIVLERVRDNLREHGRRDPDVRDDDLAAQPSAG